MQPLLLRPLLRLSRVLSETTLGKEARILPVFLPPAPSLRPPESSFRRVGRWQDDRLDRPQIELARGAVDVETDDVAVRIEVDQQTLDDLARLDVGRGFQLDVKAVDV